MGSVVEYNHRETISSVGSGSGGGDVEDILKRLGNVEASVTDVRVQVGAIAAFIPTLASAASVSAIAAVLPTLATAASVSEIAAVMPHLATKADVLAAKADVAELKTDMSAVKADVAALKTDVAAVKSDVAAVRTEVLAVKADVRADISALETKIIKWFVSTTLTAVALAFTIAKVVH